MGATNLPRGRPATPNARFSNRNLDGRMVSTTSDASQNANIRGRPWMNSN